MIEGEGYAFAGFSGTGQSRFQYSWVVCDVCRKRERIESYVAFYAPILPADWIQMFTSKPTVYRHYCSLVCAVKDKETRQESSC